MAGQGLTRLTMSAQRVSAGHEIPLCTSGLLQLAPSAPLGPGDEVRTSMPANQMFSCNLWPSQWLVQVMLHSGLFADELAHDVTTLLIVVASDLQWSGGLYTPLLVSKLCYGITGTWPCLATARLTRLVHALPDC